MSTSSKEFRFPVTVEWRGDRLVQVQVAGKDVIEIATPPEFDHSAGLEGVWSPEDFLVAAAASCYSVTLVALAERAGVPLSHLAVDAVGRVARRSDGRLGFVEIGLLVGLETETGRAEEARKVAERADELCLVSISLNLPVKVEIDVREREPAAVA